MSQNDPNLLNTKLDGIIREALEDTEEELLVVNPSSDTIGELVRVATTVDDPPHLRLLADRKTLKSAMDDFIVASNAADLVEAGVLAVRTVEESQENSLLVAPDSVVALVDAGPSVGGLTTDNESFIEDAFDAYSAMWDDADEYTLRTPPISEVQETLSEDIEPDAREDFSSVLNSLETARGDGDGLDEVTISLLVAAKNEVLLYDISRWGEDVGIASKATFSRTKTELEDKGIIDTEKVPIDVGRPRLRLKLADERLRDADGDQLASVAESILT